MIKSEVHKGLIYAGDTPLACDIVVEQTNSMELTIRAGSLTTTGQARIVSFTETNMDLLNDKIAADEAELLPDGRVRVWLKDAEGQLLKPYIFTLPSDEVISIVPDILLDIFCTVELGLLDSVPEVLVRYRLDNGFDYDEYPVGWATIQTIVFEFRIVPDLQNLVQDIFVFTVLPGFPSGTGPDDWLVQGGGL